MHNGPKTGKDRGKLVQHIRRTATILGVYGVEIVQRLSSICLRCIEEEKSKTCAIQVNEKIQ